MPSNDISQSLSLTGNKKTPSFLHSHHKHPRLFPLSPLFQQKNSREHVSRVTRPSPLNQPRTRNLPNQFGNHQDLKSSRATIVGQLRNMQQCSLEDGIAPFFHFFHNRIIIVRFKSVAMILKDTSSPRSLSRY